SAAERGPSRQPLQRQAERQCSKRWQGVEGCSGSKLNSQLLNLPKSRDITISPCRVDRIRRQPQCPRVRPPQRSRQASHLLNKTTRCLTSLHRSGPKGRRSGPKGRQFRPEGPPV